MRLLPVAVAPYRCETPRDSLVIVLPAAEKMAGVMTLVID